MESAEVHSGTEAPPLCPPESYVSIDTHQLQALDLTKPGLYRVTVTPEIAKIWLDHNDRNRRPTLQRTLSLVTVLKTNGWQFNGDAIRFSDKGDLLDGQKRLIACMMADVSIDTVLITGLPEATMPTIDIGEARSTAQHIGFRQGRDSDVRRDRYRQAIATGLLSWDSRPPCDFMTNISDIAHVPTSVEAYYFQNKEEIDAALPTINHMLTEGLYTPKNCGTLRVLFGRVDVGAADEFFKQLITGADLSEGSPILVLRRSLQKSKAQLSLRKRLPEADKTFMTIKAWNNWRSGATIRILSRNPQEDWPDILGLEPRPLPPEFRPKSDKTALRRYLACLNMDHHTAAAHV